MGSLADSKIYFGGSQSFCLEKLDALGKRGTLALGVGEQAERTGGDLLALGSLRKATALRMSSWRSGAEEDMPAIAETKT